MTNGLRVFAFLALSLAAPPSSRLEAAPLSHERLRLRNTFQTPEEVVAYYCARDASGFVWSGLLDAERKAFTTWEDSPQHDTFFVAKSYQIVPRSSDGGASSRARILVKYELVAVGDAHGTRLPPPNADYGVTFDLQRVNGAWKIAAPDPRRLAPVVLEDKFPD